MPVVIWQGALTQGTFRVVDLGAGQTPRLLVELQAEADAMGAHGWGRYEPIARDVFEAMLIASGVVA